MERIACCVMKQHGHDVVRIRALLRICNRQRCVTRLGLYYLVDRVAVNLVSCCEQQTEFDRDYYAFAITSLSGNAV